MVLSLIRGKEVGAVETLVDGLFSVGSSEDFLRFGGSA